MTDQQLRTPRNPTDRYLAAILDALGEILDRLPDRTAGARPDGSVELREPAASAPAGGGKGPSPATGGDGKGPGASTSPGRPARPSPRKAGAKTSTRKRQTSKKETP